MPEQPTIEPPPYSNDRSTRQILEKQCHMGTKSVGSSKTNSGSGSSSTITTATTKWGHIPLSYTRVNNIRTMISLSKNKIGKGRECYRYYCRISRENQTTVEVDQDQRVYPTSIWRACRSTGSNTTAKQYFPLGRHSRIYFLVTRTILASRYAILRSK